MDIVEQRFARFKDFVAGAAPDAWMLPVLMATGLMPFLATLRLRMADGLTPDDIIGRVLAFAGVDRAAFSDEQVDKLRLYVEYFAAVVVEMDEQLAAQGAV